MVKKCRFVVIYRLPRSRSDRSERSIRVRKGSNILPLFLRKIFLPMRVNFFFGVGVLQYVKYATYSSPFSRPLFYLLLLLVLLALIVTSKNFHAAPLQAPKNPEYFFFSLFFSLFFYFCSARASFTCPPKRREEKLFYGKEKEFFFLPSFFHLLAWGKSCLVRTRMVFFLGGQ